MKNIIQKLILTSIMTPIILNAGGVEIANDRFVSLVYTPTTADGTIDGYKYDGTFMLGIYGGNKKEFNKNMGYYGGLDMSVSMVDDSDTSNKPIYAYSNINIGATYSLIDSLTFLGGLGVSIQRGQYFYYGDEYETDNEIKLNAQIGVMYNIFDKFGVVLKYDTASSSIGGGLTFYL